MHWAARNDYNRCFDGRGKEAANSAKARESLRGSGVNSASGRASKRQLSKQATSTSQPASTAKGQTNKKNGNLQCGVV